DASGARHAQRARHALRASLAPKRLLVPGSRSVPGTALPRSDAVILAVDQGTTGTTCLLVDDELTIRGRGYAEVRQHYPQPGWVEHDPEEIWQSVLAAAEQAVTEPPTAIGIVNQRETTLLWDRVTGEPVHNPIVWQDR